MVALVLVMAHDVLEFVWSAYKALHDHLDWSTVAVYAGAFLASWLAYRLGLKPFLSPLRKVSLVMKILHIELQKT